GGAREGHPRTDLTAEHDSSRNTPHRLAHGRRALKDELGTKEMRPGRGRRTWIAGHDEDRHSPSRGRHPPLAPDPGRAAGRSDSVGMLSTDPRSGHYGYSTSVRAIHFRPSPPPSS